VKYGKLVPPEPQKPAQVPPEEPLPTLAPVTPEPNPNQVFGIELEEVMKRQERDLSCPDLVVPRFIFDAVKQIEQNGFKLLRLFLTPRTFTSRFVPSRRREKKCGRVGGSSRRR
jgi:hypothetical protein